MKKQIYETMDPQERKKLLEQECDQIETIGYTRKLSKDELTQRKDRLARVSIDEKEILEEKRQVMNEFLVLISTFRSQ